MKKHTIVLVMAALASLNLVGCGKKSAAPARAAMVVPVVAAQAVRQPVTEKLSLVGTLVATESVEIKSEIDGLVEQIHFEDGQRVTKGDLLVVLDDSKLKASVAEAEAQFALSESSLKRSRTLIEERLISAQEFDPVAATYHINEAILNLRRELLRDARISAPFDGTIGVRQISPGQAIAKTTGIATLVNLDPVKVEVSVPERFLSDLRIGQNLHFTVSTYQTETFTGEVYFIAPQIDANLRTTLVRARVPNREGKLKPGMFVNVDLILNVRANAVVIPEIALVPQGDTVHVFVVDAESKAQMRPIRVGLRFDGQVEILDGLTGGERVIVEGFQKTTPGGPVKVLGDTTATVVKPVTPASNRKPARRSARTAIG